MFAIEVELLGGRYRATSHSDRRRAEWPPHPARLFSALVAVLHDREPAEPTEREALQWLESLPPPALDVDLEVDAESGRRDVLDVYVPVNDISLFAALETSVREAEVRLARLREGPAAKETNPEVKKASQALGKAEKKLATTLAEEDRTVSNTEIGVATALLPDRRARRVRTFPVVCPARRTFSFIWDAEIPIEHSGALDALCERVTRLGHSSSLVRCAVIEGPRAANLIPDDRGSLVLRTVGAGQLERLEREYTRHREVENRILPSRSQRYAAARPPQVADAMPVSDFSADWIVFERVGAASVLSSKATDLGRALRSALFEQHGSRTLPPSLSGHRMDGSPAETAHVVFASLPWVGHEHADASVQGCAIIMPRKLESADREMLLNLIAGWERERALDDRSTMELAGDSLPPVRLRRVEVSSKVTTRPRTWCCPSRIFVTATPIALDRYPGNLRSNQDNVSSKAAAEAARSIAVSCERIGLPRPTSVQVSLVPLLAGAQPAYAFVPGPWRAGRPPRVRVHARIEFDRRVRGPVLLGSGRYFGLGLCMPLDEGA